MNDRLERRLADYYNESTRYLHDLSLHDDIYFESYLALMERHLPPTGELLETGCGAGASTFGIARRFTGFKCTGIDLSQAAIDHANQRFTDDRLTYAVGDATALDFPDRSFDVVTSFDCLEHIPDLEAVLREQMRLLRPGGLLIIKGPNHMSPLYTLIDIATFRHTFNQSNSWIGNFPRLASELAHQTRGMFGAVEFIPREPDLTDSVQVGNDADAVTDMSTVSVRNFFHREGWRIKRLSWPRKAGVAGSMISALAPLWGSMGVVAQKRPERAGAQGL